jgi:hypothetical protein
MGKKTKGGDFVPALRREINSVCCEIYLPVRAKECTQPCIRDLAF